MLQSIQIAIFDINTVLLNPKYVKFHLICIFFFRQFLFLAYMIWCTTEELFLFGQRPMLSFVCSIFIHEFGKWLAGSEGIDKIFSPEKLGRGSSFSSAQSNLINECPVTSTTTSEMTVALLEEVITDSQLKCAALLTELSSSDSSMQHLATVKQLTQKLQSMQSLLTQLKSQI